MLISLPPAARMRGLFAHCVALLIVVASLDASAQASPPGQAGSEPPAAERDPPSQTLDPVVITATQPDDSSAGAARLDQKGLAPQRVGTSDTTQLLQDIPGVSVYSAGGISGLPVIRGLADDRLRVQVDGMSLMQACPNHMNSVLSYIDPSSVAGLEVFAGITPVSLGGDSIGGTIEVKSAAPKFATAEQGILVEGRAGFFSRSNGNARGSNAGFTLAGEHVSLSYTDSSSESENYWAASEFKKPGAWKANLLGIAMGARKVGEREVGASEYGGAWNRDLGLALRFSDHLLQLNVSQQQLDYEGFPNQRMDMIASIPDPSDPSVPSAYIVVKDKPSNVNRTVNLRYNGQYQWGALEGRIFQQDIRHHMDMIQERNFGMLMPMDTLATTVGGLLKGSIEVSETDTLRVGSDFQKYRMGDWWPPIAGGASMCCNDFWNIRDGKRDRLGIFAEWEARWGPQWLTLAGIRSDTVRMDAGRAQGYSNGSYKVDADKFNARDHLRVDHNLDWTLLARYTHNAMQTYEAGFARKTRSPNVHERYPWSTFAMAALMNNFVGDGNGYVGNLDLKPEVAHTFSVTGDWHDAEKSTWGLKATGYLTKVRDFVDARRCGPPVCNTAAYLTTSNQYVLLQYVNQWARLHGFDVSGQALLGRSEDLGSFSVTGSVSYVRGVNLSTGDNLYHMMPLNKKLALVHRLAGWTMTAELQWVDDKKHVSWVRNEMPTNYYSLLNLRSSYEWKYARVDVGVENLLNKFYLLPLGGAYLGQGNSMTTNGVPYGMTLPGRARSLNLALSVNF
jgi:iron complex outermembrane receptor protein